MAFHGSSEEGVTRRLSGWQRLAVPELRSLSELFGGKYPVPIPHAGATPVWALVVI